MGTPNDALRKAAGEIGYYAPADPLPGSKYGRWESQKLHQPWLAGPSTSVWWCAIFVSWVLDGIASLGGTPGFNTDTILSAATKIGQRLGNPRDAIPGDVVIYDWNHNGSTDHIGIIELNRGSYIQTIEGNTSSGVSGSQSSGNGVYRRTRNWSGVAAVVRPAYANTAPVAAPAAHGGTSIAEDGWWGSDTTGRLQEVLGTPHDCIVSNQWAPNAVFFKCATSGWQWDRSGVGSQLIKAMQRSMGVKDDGLVGIDFVHALESRYGFNPDNRLDGPSNTIKKMQANLNQGRF